MTQTHSISIGIERFENTLYIVMKAAGKLTHADYQAFTPLLVDVTAFSGWELRAAWDDFKIGLKHGNEFEKIAIVGNKDWQALMATVGDWFIGGEANYFTDSTEAINWLCE